MADGGAKQLFNRLQQGQHLLLKSFSDTGEKVGTVSLMDAETEDPETGKTQSVKIIKTFFIMPCPGFRLMRTKPLPLILPCA
jgi:hypothetical protein